MSAIVDYNQNMIDYQGKLVDFIPILEYGLISEWNFENNLNDSFGKWNITPLITPRYVPGKIGYGFDASLNNVYNTIFGLISPEFLTFMIGFPSWTITFWYYPRTNSGEYFNSPLLTFQGCPPYEGGYDPSIGITRIIIQSFLRATLSQIEIRRENLLSSGYDDIDSVLGSSYLRNLYQWYFIVVSSNATSIKLKVYDTSTLIDDTSTKITRPFFTPDVSTVMLMGDPGNETSFQNDIVDQMRFYNRDLSKEVIDAIWNNGVGI